MTSTTLGTVTRVKTRGHVNRETGAARLEEGVLTFPIST
jgi:hypothetical protein